MNEKSQSATGGKKPLIALWTGRVLTGLVTLGLGMSGIMKIKGGPEVTEGLAHLGISESLLIPLAIVELTCLLIYLFPQTAVLGGILLTGYLGGATFAHVRVADGFAPTIILGVLVWLSLALRDGRLWSLIPLRLRSTI
jgi:hypothetical protein